MNANGAPRTNSTKKDTWWRALLRLAENLGSPFFRFTTMACIFNILIFMEWDKLEVKFLEGPRMPKAQTSANECSFKCHGFESVIKDGHLVESFGLESACA